MKLDRRLLLSRRQEKKGMVRFGGVTNPRSGAGWSRKNDGRTADELVEFKRTDNKRSITLLYDDLISLFHHALGERRRPVLCFELGGRDWVVLPEPDYHELVLRGSTADSAQHLRTGQPSMAGRGQVSRAARQPVLRRLPAQQQPGARGQVGVSRNPPGAPRPLPGPGGLSGLRHRQRGEVGGLGRNQRKGAASDQAPEAS